MKRFISILLLSYYVSATLCFPGGNFSSLTDLPEMYRHCKATEDKDMTPFDFLTDHLMNIDGLFDKHENGDEQKPHAPFPFHHLEVPVYFPLINLTTINCIDATQTVIPVYEVHYYRAGFLPTVFRPPIV